MADALSGAASGAAAGTAISPGWGTVIGAAIGAIGGIITNRQNAKQAENQQNFQASQTSTAWQRGVADMQAAGLSPMLAYSQGPAQSAQGAQAVMQNPTLPIQKGIDQAIAVQDLERATSATEASNRLMATQETGISADVQLKHMQALLAAQHSATSAAEEARIRKQIEELEASIHGTKLNNDYLSQSMQDRLTGVRLGNKYTEANTARAVEETAGRKQQRGFDYSLMPSRTREQIANEGSAILNMVRGNMDANRWQAESNAWGSAWGQGGRAYLGDIGTVTNSARSIYQIGR